MSRYSLTEIKVAAYNWEELPNMTVDERNLWQGLGFVYECYRCGESKELCEKMAQQYIRILGRNINHD